MNARVGEANLQKIQMLGIPLDKAEEMFSMAAYGHRVVIDKN